MHEDNRKNLSVINGGYVPKGWIIHCVTVEGRRYHHVVLTPPKRKSIVDVRMALLEQARGLWLSEKYATVQLAYHDGVHRYVSYFRHKRA